MRKTAKSKDKEFPRLRMSKKRNVDEFFDEWYIRNRRYDTRNAVLKENVLAFVFYDTDIAALGVLVMNDIVVFPLRFD